MARRARLDKTKVIEEAARLINEQDLERLSLGCLAERLGVRVPSLYNHVAGLPGLKRDLTLYCLCELLTRLTRSVIGKARGEAVLAFALTYREYAREVPSHYALTLQAPDFNDDELQNVARQIVEIVLAVLEPYKLGEQEAIHAIRGLRSIVQGFISLEVAGGFGMPIDVDASFHWLISLFISALEQPAGPL
jgi:AcrR family transcriptional regulator